MAKEIRKILETFKFEFKRSNKSIFLYIFIVVALPIFLIRILGVLQPLEYALYDFWYHTKPVEGVDERIVIVEWNEASIDKFNQAVISDDTLADVLNKIIEQNPRAIGIDLYRDVTNPNRALNSIENMEAWLELTDIFDKNDNIIGIKKIIEPKIKPPAVLEKKQRVAAADLSLDSDSTIRRAYAFPSVDRYGHPVKVPYIGWALGFKYLEAEQWDSEAIPENERRISRLKIFDRTNRHEPIFFERSLHNISNVFDFDRGWSFLINWRKTELTNNFVTISVMDLLDRAIERDLFRDRLVIIGNTAVSRGDIHYTPLNRWNQKDWTFGVEIVAQTASTFISAAKDKRPIVRLAPMWSEYVLFLLSIIGLALYSQTVFKKDRSIVALRKNLIIICVVSLIALIFLNFILFNYGIWLNTSASIVGIIFSSLFVSYHYQYQKQVTNLQKIVLLVRNTNHNLSDVAASLNDYCSNIDRLKHAILKKLRQEELDYGYELELNHDLKSDIKNVESNIEGIKDEIYNIQYSKKRIKKFINYTYTGKLSQLEISDFNREINRIVVYNTIKNINTEQVSFEQYYDSSIDLQKIYVEELEIIVENLLKNAISAIKVKTIWQPSHSPKIRLSTKRKENTLAITIKDNGVGISDEMKPKIFDLGFSLIGAGDGVGLYLVRQAVDYWGGSISVASVEGEGTCFTVLLPML